MMNETERVAGIHDFSREVLSAKEPSEDSREGWVEWNITLYGGEVPRRLARADEERLARMAAARWNACRDALEKMESGFPHTAEGILRAALRTE